MGRHVLSLYRLGQKCWVTYGSRDQGGVFQIHTKKGIVEFKPSNKGLHALNLKDNPEAAYLLVNNMELLLPMPDNPPAHQIHVNMVHDNYKGSSHKQIEQATTAQRLMNMDATLSTCDFQGLEVHLNLLKDCPVTNDDIKTAHIIFGPNLATIRGKMVWRKWTRVTTDYVDIPRALIDVNSCVKVAADIMFVNKVPFLGLVLHNINLITIEHAPHRNAIKLGSLLHQICYTRLFESGL